MILLISVDYRPISEEARRLYYSIKDVVHWLPRHRKNLIELMKFYPFCKLTEEIIHNISRFYLRPYDYAIPTRDDFPDLIFDPNFRSLIYLKSLKERFEYIKPLTEFKWKDIIKKAQSEKLIIYSPGLERSIARKLSKIPPDNLEYNLVDGSHIRAFPASIIKFTDDFPIIKNVMVKQVKYEPKQLLLNLFQKGKPISIPSDPAYVLNIHTDDYALADFLISDIAGNRKIFWHDAQEDLEGVSDLYDLLVVKNFNQIGLQKQNNLWNVLKSIGFNKKPILLVGKNSKVIPTIKDETYLIETEPFDFKSIREEFIRFLCYYYYKSGGIKQLFSLFYNIDESYHKKIFFRAANFNVLLEAIKKFRNWGGRAFYHPIFLYGLQLQIEKCNEIEKRKEEKPSVIKTTPEYIWKFRGDFWEISFNYSEPILVRDVMGMFYIGKFLENAGKKISISDLREKAGISATNARPSNSSALNNPLQLAIEIIEEKENQFDYKKDLSKYLRIIIDGPGLFQGIDSCTWPKKPGIEWKVFCPKKYFIKERGTHNLDGI